MSGGVGGILDIMQGCWACGGAVCSEVCARMFGSTLLQAAAWAQRCCDCLGLPLLLCS